MVFSLTLYYPLFCLCTFIFIDFFDLWTHSTPLQGTTPESTRAPNQRTTHSRRDQSTEKSWSSTNQRRHSKQKQKQKSTRPSSDEYCEDEDYKEDYWAPDLSESPYEGIDYREQLIKHRIVPDFIHAVPDYLLEIFYWDAVVNYGNMLTFNETKLEPRIIKWHYEPKKYYTLIMTDPDGPFGDARSHEEEWHHWLITNIYGNYIGIGDVYAQYIGVIPSRGKHIHRYVFLVYEQPGNGTIDFDEIHLGPEPINMLRGYFSTLQFAKKYNLTGPRACNFFLADWSKAPLPEPSTDDYYDVIIPDNAPDRECCMGEAIHDFLHQNKSQ